MHWILVLCVQTNNWREHHCWHQGKSPPIATTTSHTTRLPCLFAEIKIAELYYIRHLVSYGIQCRYGNFRMTLLINKWPNIVMVDGWVHPLAKSHLLLSAACDEILSWTTESFIINYLVSNYIATLQTYNFPNVLQGSTSSVGIAFSVGVTRYHIYSSNGPLQHCPKINHTSTQAFTLPLQPLLPAMSKSLH